MTIELVWWVLRHEFKWIVVFWGRHKHLLKRFFEWIVMTGISQLSSLLQQQTREMWLSGNNVIRIFWSFDTAVAWWSPTNRCHVTILNSGHATPTRSGCGPQSNARNRGSEVEIDCLRSSSRPVAVWKQLQTTKDTQDNGLTNSLRRWPVKFLWHSAKACHCMVSKVEHHRTWNITERTDSAPPLPHATSLFASLNWGCPVVFFRWRKECRELTLFPEDGTWTRNTPRMSTTFLTHREGLPSSSTTQSLIQKQDKKTGRERIMMLKTYMTLSSFLDLKSNCS